MSSMEKELINVSRQIRDIEKKSKKINRGKFTLCANGEGKKVYIANNLVNSYKNLVERRQELLNSYKTQSKNTVKEENSKNNEKYVTLNVDNLENLKNFLDYNISFKDNRENDVNREVSYAEVNDLIETMLNENSGSDEQNIGKYDRKDEFITPNDLSFKGELLDSDNYDSENLYEDLIDMCNQIEEDSNQNIGVSDKKPTTLDENIVVSGDDVLCDEEPTILDVSKPSSDENGDFASLNEDEVDVEKPAHEESNNESYDNFDSPEVYFSVFRRIKNKVFNIIKSRKSKKEDTANKSVDNKNIFKRVKNKVFNIINSRKSKKEDTANKSVDNKNIFKRVKNKVFNVIKSRKSKEEDTANKSVDNKNIFKRTKNKVSKIEKIKEPREKKKIKYSLVKATIAIALTVTTSFAAFGILNSYNKKKNNPDNNDSKSDVVLQDNSVSNDIKPIPDKDITDHKDNNDVKPSNTKPVQNTVNKEVDVENDITENSEVNLGNIIKVSPSSKIYDNIYDATNGTNGLKRYFENNVNRYIVYVAFEYNGQVIYSSSEKEIELLTNKGAKMVAVGTSLVKGGDCEGFYNCDDVVVLNNGGRTR